MIQLLMEMKLELRMKPKELKMKIIFFGTPYFAIPSLQAVIDEENIEIPLVISQPDRKRSRNKLSPTPVKKLALEERIEVLTPENVNDSEILARLLAVDPDVLVVIAYGQFIGQKILEAFPNRIVNIHGSLLPAYRGAAPIQRAMLDGEDITGVTAMLIEKEMDAGPMLGKSKVTIEDQDSLDSLTEKMAQAGADLLIETLADFDNKVENAEKQDPNQVSFANKIEKSDGYLDFNNEGKTLLNQIRTLKDWPGAKFKLGDEIFKVHQAHLVERNNQFENGYIWSSDGELCINTKDSSLAIDIIQAPNKKAMPIEDYLRGNPIEPKQKVEMVDS